MKKISISIILLFIFESYSIAQSFIGRWQENSAEVSSGYLNNYQFLDDSTFLYNTSEYFGLKNIVSIGGKYKYNKNSKSLLLTVQFTNQIVGGHIVRSKESGSATDSWVIEGGEVKKTLLAKPVRAFISVDFLSPNKEGNELVLFDKRKYYKVE